MKILKEIFKHTALFLIGGVVYIMIELGFRGYSHWTMFIVGGLCFLLIGGINNWLSWDLPIWIQGVIGDLAVLVMEFISGCIINLWLGWGVWDYSDLPLNLLGQICLPFAFLWFPLAIVGIVLDDYLRYWLFEERKPKYKLWFK